MTIEAELPDGTILEFPDGTDQSVIQSAVKSTLSTGSPPAQQPTGGRSGRGQQLQQERLTEREQFLQSVSPERRALLESINPAEAAIIGIGRGFTDIGRGVGLADQGGDFEQQAFADLERVQPIATGGQIVGQAAPFVPLGLGAAGIVSTPLRVGATTALGAAEGGAISRGQGGDLGEQFLSAGIGGTVAGALELGIPVLGRLGGKIIRRVTGRAPKGAVIDATGKPSAELLKALDDEGLQFDDLLQESVVSLKDEVINPEQAARKAFLESQGIEPTKAQVTRLATDFQQQQELAKKTSRVRNALQKQNAALTTRFNNAVLETGGAAQTPTNTVVDAITERATVLDKEIGQLYKQAREIAPGEKNVKLAGLDKQLRRLMPQNRKGGFNIESVIGELKEKGVLNKKGALVGKIDVNSAEEVRQSINSLFDPANGFGNIQLRMLKDSLDDDVFKSAGGDVFKQARDAKTNFEKGLTRSKLSKFDSRKANLVRDVLENKISPDTFTKDVVFSKKWRGEDLEQLKTYLQADDIGKKAFSDLRADVMEEIKLKSFSGEIDENGLQTITRARLEGALNSLGDKKIEVLFNPKERRFLSDMLKVSKLRAPVPGTFTGEGPSAQAINSTKNKLSKQLEKLGIFSDIIEGLAVNSQGKIAVKAAPDRIIRPITGSQTRQAVALGGGALSTQALGDEQ